LKIPIEVLKIASSIFTQMFKPAKALFRHSDRIPLVRKLTPVQRPLPQWEKNYYAFLAISTGFVAVGRLADWASGISRCPVESTWSLLPEEN
jgi:hypothetical protein